MQIVNAMHRKNLRFPIAAKPAAASMSETVVGSVEDDLSLSLKGVATSWLTCD